MPTPLLSFCPCFAPYQVNKHFHIYAGWFAYVAGLVQCYRGLELVASSDNLIFSAVDISFKVRTANFPPPVDGDLVSFADGTCCNYVLSGKG